MSHRPARATHAVVGAVAIALIATACSDSGDDASTSTVAVASVPDSGSTAPAGPTYVVEAGDALSTIGDAYGVSAQQIADANDWSDGIGHVIQPGQTIRLPAGAQLLPGATTVRPTTAPGPTGAPAGPTTSGATATTTAASPSGYAPVDTPPRPGHTAPIDASWVQPDGSLRGIADGDYWSWDAQVAGGSVRFHLVQMFSGDDCTQQFGTDPDTCLDSLETTSDPTGTITMSADVDDVVVCDGMYRGCYGVDGREYVRLLGGGDQSPAAPADFQFVDWPVIVTVRGGAVVAVQSQLTS